jgi:hypothetical protein
MLGKVQLSSSVHGRDDAVKRAFFIKVWRVLQRVCTVDWNRNAVRTHKLALDVVTVEPCFVVR